jgi:hypothetical protein
MRKSTSLGDKFSSETPAYHKHFTNQAIKLMRKSMSIVQNGYGMSGPQKGSTKSPATSEGSGA